MIKAIWRDKVIAESDKTVVVENNHYFPRESVHSEYLSDSDMHSTCPWKGNASYYSVVVDGETNEDAAWYYPEPKPDASKIKDHIAFWKGVEIVEE